MIHFLGTDLSFPDAMAARADGLLAIGGDLSAERLVLAYRSGIFPWFGEGDPILWWSPDPRMVLFPAAYKPSKSLRKIIRSDIFSITQNTAFNQVIEACAAIPRPGQNSTWITPEMLEAYKALHQQGRAQSVEVWQDEQLVGGLYGIDLPEYGIFCGESMFTRVSNASKVGFNFLVSHLKTKDYKLIDCQIYTDHLASLGAVEIDRAVFLSYLK